MKLIPIFIALFILFGCETNSSFKSELRVIPMPQNVEFTKGYFDLNDVFIDVSNPLLQDIMVESLDEYSVYISQEIEGHNLLKIQLNDSLENRYKMNVSQTEILIEASDEQLAFYAIQTLLQSIIKHNDGWVIPKMEIVDYPYFPHRGFLLDCSRHFFSVDVVKKYIDLLAYYKMNVLHWHLTEDQGWRIEIDRYPKLTEIGAWRTEKDGSVYGGYYTKDQIREIVDYANERFVTIIPEIELPGHSQAALAAYPEFSCVGKGIEVVNEWGVFKEIYCAGNEGTFVFLENVLTEVMELFPSEYIHIGGDEAPKYRWEHCDKCQRRIKEEGLRNEHELQSYFIERIETFLNDNGRKLIGWDEIMEGGMSPNAVVQSWRGMSYGRDAARENHKVIFSPTSHAYLDYSLESIDLKKVYSFNLIPEDLEGEYHQNILGGEVNMWTEHVPDESTLDQKVFPRLLAFSEVAWTFDKERSFEEFYGRVQEQYDFLERKDVDYGLEGKSVYITSNSNLDIQLDPGLPDLDLSYSINGSDFLAYENPIELNFSGTLLAMAKKGNSHYGDTVRQKVEYHKAFGVLPELTSEYNPTYTAGGKMGLADGLLASDDFRDGKWQGYFGEHITGIINLGKEQEVESVSANFYQYNNAWIFLPLKVDVYLSKDGKEWIWIGETFPQIEPKKRGKYIENMIVKADEVLTAKYVKFSAENQLTVPEWHEAAGSKAWLFIDEIIVK